MSDSFHIDDPTWKKIKEPPAAIFFVFLNIASLVFPLLLAWLWISVSPAAADEITTCLNSILNFENSPLFLGTITLWGIYLLLIPLLHELIHLLMYPSPIASHKCYLVILPRYLAAAAYYTDEISRNRFLAVIIAPLVVLSLIPFGICIFYFSPLLFIPALLNFGMAAGDIASFFLVIGVTKSDWILKNQGYNTYYRHHGVVI